MARLVDPGEKRGLRNEEKNKGAGKKRGRRGRRRLCAAGEGLSPRRRWQAARVPCPAVARARAPAQLAGPGYPGSEPAGSVSRRSRKRRSAPSSVSSRALRELSCPSIGVARLTGPPEPAQQLTPGGVQVAEVLEARPSTTRSPASGPSVSAMAMARSSSTTGEPARRESSAYSSATCSRRRTSRCAGRLPPPAGRRARRRPARAPARDRRVPRRSRRRPRATGPGRRSARARSRDRASRRESCKSIIASRPRTPASSGSPSARRAPTRSPPPRARHGRRSPR